MIQRVEGDRGHKNIGSISNNGPDPMKITKLPSQHSMLDHQRHASKTSFQWRFAGVPMIVRLLMFGCALLSSLLGRRQFNDIVTVCKETLICTRYFNFFSKL